MTKEKGAERTRYARQREVEKSNKKQRPHTEMGLKVENKDK